jgi:hypothetical protein
VWGIEIELSGNRLLKIGDGKHYWQDLPYVDETYIKGLSEKLAALAQQGDGLVNAVQSLEEALAAESAARIQNDNALQVSIGDQVQSEATLRLQGDTSLRLLTEAELQTERTARESLQFLVGQLLEFIREQMGPFAPIELLTDNGFNVATYGGKTIVTLLDINHII